MQLRLVLWFFWPALVSCRRFTTSPLSVFELIAHHMSFPIHHTMPEQSISHKFSGLPTILHLSLVLNLVRYLLPSNTPAVARQSSLSLLACAVQDRDTSSRSKNKSHDSTTPPSLQRMDLRLYEREAHGWVVRRECSRVGMLLDIDGDWQALSLSRWWGWGGERQWSASLAGWFHATWILKIKLVIHFYGGIVVWVAGSICFKLLQWIEMKRWECETWSLGREYCGSWPEILVDSSTSYPILQVTIPAYLGTRQKYSQYRRDDNLEHDNMHHACIGDSIVPTACMQDALLHICRYVSTLFCQIYLLPHQVVHALQTTYLPAAFSFPLPLLSFLTKLRHHVSLKSQIWYLLPVYNQPLANPNILSQPYVRTYVLALALISCQIWVVCVGKLVMTSVVVRS